MDIYQSNISLLRLSSLKLVVSLVSRYLAVGPADHGELGVVALHEEPPPEEVLYDVPLTVHSPVPDTV